MQLSDTTLAAVTGELQALINNDSLSEYKDENKLMVLLTLTQIVHFDLCLSAELRVYTEKSSVFGGSKAKGMP